LFNFPTLSKGLIHHETAAIGILCPKESHEIEEILIAYKKCKYIFRIFSGKILGYLFLLWFFSVFDKDLDADLKKEGLGLLGRIFRSITTGGREVSTAISFSRANKELAKQEAQELYDVILYFTHFVKILTYLKAYNYNVLFSVHVAILIYHTE